MKKTPQDPSLQGAGKYYAARRQRAATQKFVQAGKVPPAATATATAPPKDVRQAQDVDADAVAPARGTARK